MQGRWLLCLEGEASLPCGIIRDHSPPRPLVFHSLSVARNKRSPSSSKLFGGKLSKLSSTRQLKWQRIGFNSASDIRFKSLSRFLQVWIGPEIFAPKWFHFWILCHCCHIRSQPDVRGVTRGEVTWEARQAVPMAGACLDSQRNPHKPHLCPVSFSPLNQRQHA